MGKIIHQINTESQETNSQADVRNISLQYCMEGCYKLERPLKVTCLSYSKAFDSIRRGQIIDASTRTPLKGTCAKPLKFSKTE